MRTALATRSPRVAAPLAATMTALALIAAGCGTSEKKDTPAADASAVSGYIPSGALVYAEMSTDTEGAQWKQIDSLAKTFPAYSELRKQMDEDLTSGSVNFDKDVKPLLGGRAAVGVLTIPTSSAGSAPLTVTSPGGTTVPNMPGVATAAEDGEYVAAIELKAGKEAEAEALIAKNAQGTPTTLGSTKVYQDKDGESYAAVVPGAILIGSTPDQIKAAIDAKAAGGPATLAGNSRFTDAISKLPQETFAQGYVDLGQMLQVQAKDNPTLQSQAKALAMYKDMRIATSAAAEAEGGRVKGVLLGGPEAPDGTTFAPSLNARVPANALFYYGLNNLQAQVAQGIQQYVASGQNPQIVDQANAASGQLQSMLGISLDDLKALGEKEHAIVVTPGLPYPNVAVALQVDDPGRAAKTLDALRTASPSLLAQANVPAANQQWSQVPLEGGVTGWDLPVAPSGHVTYGVDGKLALIGSSPVVLKQIQRPTQPLSDSELYKKGFAGIPEDVTSVTWVNVGEAVRVGETAGAFKDEPDVVPNLKRIASISGWTTGGDEQTFEVFVRLNPTK